MFCVVSSLWSVIMKNAFNIFFFSSWIVYFTVMEHTGPILSVPFLPVTFSPRRCISAPFVKAVFCSSPLKPKSPSVLQDWGVAPWAATQRPVGWRRAGLSGRWGRRRRPKLRSDTVLQGSKYEFSAPAAASVASLQHHSARSCPHPFAPKPISVFRARRSW